MPISEQAFQLCGERKNGEQLVFAGLPDPSWINRPIKKWVAEAGITKHITYHCFRHSYATLQLAGGTDIYTVSKMLGHTNYYSRILVLTNRATGLSCNRMPRAGSHLCHRRGRIPFRLSAA